MTDEDRFIKDVRAELKRLVESTDARTRARLHRQVDVAIAGRVQERPVRRVAWQVGAVAVSTVAVMLAMHLWRDELVPPGHGGAPPAAADDVALLLNVDIDLLERMEFYRWLEQQPGILEGERGSGAREMPQPSQR
jgi:hypothetical protein